MLLVSPVFAEKPFPVIGADKKVNPSTLNRIVDDIYDTKMDKSLAIDNYSNQTIAGDKTFTGSTTISSATITNATVTSSLSLPLSGQGMNPVGTVITYVSTTPPAGYLKCNGVSYSTATYSALFTIIGYGYGGSNGNFNVPDYRGYFLRASDDGSGQDPDNTYVGQTQQDQFQGHWHDVFWVSVPASGGVATNAFAGSGAFIHQNNISARDVQSDGTNGTPRIGGQTRPKNIAVAYMIKY